jgi:hypothetical protein
VGVEIDQAIEVAYPQHGVKYSHDDQP